MLAVLAVALLPRLLFLGADPPQDMHEHFFTDEAWWAHNARNHAVFGRWIMDDHNPPLYGAPLYTVVLRGVYELLGTGLVPTRLLAAVSGALASVVLYLGLRARHPRGEALVPALLLGCSYFAISHSRVGLVESFQLLLIVTAGVGVRLAAERPAWGYLGGVGLVLALLAKPTAMALIPAFGLFWLLHWYAARRDPSLPPFQLESPRRVIFAAAAAGVLALALWLWPVRHEIMNQMRVSRIVSFTDHGIPRVEFLGLGLVGLRRNGFISQSVVPLLLVALLAAGRLSRREGPRPSLTEWFGWAWLGGALLLLLPQHYQVDRRFLLLWPAVAILAAPAMRAPGLALPGRFEGTGARWRGAAAGLALGGVLGMILLPWLAEAAGGMVAALGGTPESAIVTPVWHLAAAVGALLGWWAGPRLPATPRILPRYVALGAFLLAEPLRFAEFLRRPTFTIHEASDSLAALTHHWPERDRVIVGLVADEFAMNTRLFPFVMRARQNTGVRMNLDGWTRFEPKITVNRIRPGSDDEEGHGEAYDEARARDFRVWRVFPIWPDASGKPRYLAEFLVAPAHCPECPRLAGAPDQR